MSETKRLQHLTLLAGIVPLIAIHAAYVIAAIQGYVGWCIPYWDSCTSISATGRHGIAYGWFKLTMISSAVILFLVWREIYRWQSSIVQSTHRTLMLVGCMGAVCLAMYTIALGEAGEYFRKQRQLGATVYFTFTYLAQLMLVAWLFRNGVRSIWRTYLFIACASCLLIGVYSLSIDAYTDWHDDIEDAIEWILALLIDLNFLAFYYYLRSSRQQTAVR